MGSTLINLLARAAVPATVLLVFALARRHLPAGPAKEFAAYPLDGLTARFAVTQWVVGIAMLAVGVAIAGGTYEILVGLSQFFVSREGPADFVLLPQTAIWWFLPLFAALDLSWEATLALWSLIGRKSEVALYNYWTTAKAGFDSTRILRIMAVTIVLPIAILTALAVPMHAVLQSGGIRAQGYGFSQPRIDRYADARRMTVIEGFRDRYGKLTRRAGIVLDFADGRRWSSAAIGDFKPVVDGALLQYLESKTGLTPLFAEAESDIPSIE